MDFSTPGFPILNYLPEFAHTHVHWVSDAIQPSHPLSPTSPLTINLSQHQGLFQWVDSSHQVAKSFGASASVLPMNIQGWCALGFTGLISLSDQIRSVTQSCPTPCDPMNRSTPGLPVHHQLPEYTQTHIHHLGDAIQPSHPLLSPSPPAPNPSQHQSLFQWVSSSHEVAKVLEFQLQHHSFQRNPRADLLQNGLVGSPYRNYLSVEFRSRISNEICTLAHDM